MVPETNQSDLGEVAFSRYREKYATKPVDRNVILPYHVKSVLNTFKPSKVTWNYNGPQSATLSLRMSGYPIFADGWLPSLPKNTLYDLRKKVIDKIRGTKFNSAVNTGEAFEAISQIRTFAETGAQLLINLKKGDLAAAAKTVGLTTSNGMVWKNRDKRFAKKLRRGQKVDQTSFTSYMSSTWLATQLGWEPLFESAKSAAEFLVDAQMYEPATIIRTSKRLKYSDSNNAAGDNKVVWGSLVGERLCYGQIRAYVRLRPRPEAEIDTGFSRPLSVLYALTPGSFILDWFYPFGDIIDQIGAFKDVQVEVACYSITLSKRESYHPNLNLYPPGAKISEEGDNSVRVDVYTRSLWDVTSFIPPTPMLPQVSIWKMTTTLALLKTVMFKS